MTKKNPSLLLARTRAIGLLLLIAFLPFSCSHENGPSDTACVAFQLDLLNTTYETAAPSRITSEDPAEITLKQANMTDLYIFDGTTLLCHQQSTDPKFGTPSIELPYGEHTITFVTCPQQGQTFSDGIWSAPKANDTFGYVAHINVESATATEPIVLYRCTYSLKWQSTDIVPSGARTLVLKVSPMREILTDGLVGTNGYERTYTYDVTSYIGRTISVTVNGLPSEFGVEENITSTISFLDDSDNILFTHTKSIPVLTNRRTIITGALFNGSATTSIRLNSNWLTDYETNL